MELKIYPPLAIHELGARGNQEDYVYPLDGQATVDDHLFIVCDGMGGHENGEVASETFAAALADYFMRNVSADYVLSDATLDKAIDYAYAKLDAKDDGNYKKMGTTLTLLYLHKGGVTAAHIGDSRIYHLRPGKRILYISRDHSLVYDLYQSGEISYGEIKTSQQKNVITRAVQPGEDNRVKPDVIHITDIKPDDYFYLCSDGMLEMMDDDELFKLLSGRGSDEKKLNKLIAATSGNQDNHSAYLIHVKDVKKDPAEENLTKNEEETARFNALNMKQVKNVGIEDLDTNDDDDDDITRISQSPEDSNRSHPEGNKKSITWLWWALLIAAIVAIAAWLTLYGLGIQSMLKKARLWKRLLRRRCRSSRLPIPCRIPQNLMKVQENMLLPKLLKHSITENKPQQNQDNNRQPKMWNPKAMVRIGHRPQSKTTIETVE